MVRVKICGISTIEEALAAVNAKALELEKHAYEISDVYKQTLPAK